jgi:hypothetical protein
VIIKMLRGIIGGLRAIGQKLTNTGPKKKKKSNKKESTGKKVGKFLVRSAVWMFTHSFIVIIFITLISIAGVSVAVIMPKGSPKHVQVCDTPKTTTANSDAATGDWTQDGTQANKTAKAVWDYLNNKHWSAAAIAGAVGNISVEDGSFVLEQQQIGGGGGVGLFQFTPGTKFAQPGSPDWQDVGKQIEYFIAHQGVAQNPDYTKMTDVQAAALKWEDFEGPSRGDDNGHAARRIAGAQKAYEMWGSTASQDGSGSVIDQASSSAGTTASSSKSSNNDCDTDSTSSNVTAGMVFAKDSKGIVLNAGLDDVNHEDIPGATPYHGPGAHDGWDINSITDPSGSKEEDIYAIAPGDVVGLSNGVAGVLQFIDIKLSDGTYLEYQEFKSGSIPSSIQKGTKVTAGQKIGQIGDAGATGGVHSGKYVHITWADSGAQVDSKGSVTGYSANSHTRSLGELLGINADRWVNAPQTYTWDQMSKIKTDK